MCNNYDMIFLFVKSSLKFRSEYPKSAPLHRHTACARGRLFIIYYLIDRRYNKEGNFNIVFTSYKHPSHWRSNFNEDDALLCALDRIFDDATVFNIKGESFRGKKLETVALQTSRVKAPDSSETPTL